VTFLLCQVATATLPPSPKKQRHGRGGFRGVGGPPGVAKGARLDGRLAEGLGPIQRQPAERASPRGPAPSVRAGGVTVRTLRRLHSSSLRLGPYEGNRAVLAFGGRGLGRSHP